MSLKLTSIISLLTFFLLNVSCTSRSASVINPYLPNLIDSRPAIIFIHGFYGSALREKNIGRRIFFTGREALFGKSALSLFQKQLGTPPGPELEVEGLLASVPVLPGLYEVDVYSTFIRNLRSNQKKSQVLPLVYDWRDDLSKAVHKLDELVQLLQKRGAPEISIVAHSMGGLVAIYYLAYGNQQPEAAKLSWEGAKKIQKAVFFGTPFGGSMISFRSFEKGSGLAKSDRLLSADTMASFPSLYQLLPSMASVLDKNGIASTLPIFEIETWKTQHFGLLRRKGLSPQLIAEREKFTEAQLIKAKRWSSLVQLGRIAVWPTPPESFRALNVVSAKQDTLDLAYLLSDSGKLLFDPDEVKAAGLSMKPLYIMGDGTVSRASAEVPVALEAATKVLTSDYSHENLFLDPDVESEYNDFLMPKMNKAEQRNGEIL